MYESLLCKDPTLQFLDVEYPAETILQVCPSPIQIEISFQYLAFFLLAILFYGLRNGDDDDGEDGSRTFENSSLRKWMNPLITDFANFDFS